MRRAIGLGVALQWRAARRETLAVVAVQIVDAAVLAVQLLVIRHILDLLSRADRPSFADFVPALVTVTATYTARSVSRAFVREQQAVIGSVVQRDVTQRILGAASRAEVSDFENPDFHDRLVRLRTETYRHVWNVVWGIVGLASQVLVTLSMVVVLASIAPVVLIVGAVGALPFLWANRRMSSISYSVTVEQTALGRERVYLEDLLTSRSSAPELRSLGVGPHLVGRTRALYDRYIDALRTQGNRRLRVSLVSGVVASLLAAVALALLVAVAIDGRLTIAEAGVAVLALQQVTNQLRGMADALGEIDAATPFLHDFARFEAEDAPRLLAVTESPSALPPLESLVLDHVSFTYPGTEHEVLHEISLRLDSGDVVAVVGQNGSGKTTMAKLIGGLYEPTAGTIRWNGGDRATYDSEAVRRTVALVFQDFGRYELTARDNIAFGDIARLDDSSGVLEAARRSGADEFLSELPDGYSTLLSRSFEHGVELSGGQWQRVAIARAFFRDAPILVLDEPTAALDPLAEQELFERLRSLAAGRTVVLISHRFSTVRSADRILVLDAGRLIEQGTHEDLMALGGHYAEMFSVQAAPYTGG